MEQVVWLYFGLISVILAIAIVGTLIINFKGENKVNAFDHALDKFKQQCDFICKTPPSTLQSISVDLPSGLYLFTEQDTICGVFDGEKRCVRCACALDTYSLPLNTTLALQSFDIQTYRCSFMRGPTNVSMDCQG